MTTAAAGKILFVLQWWGGDAHEVGPLLELITELRAGERCAVADVLLAWKGGPVDVAAAHAARLRPCFDQVHLLPCSELVTGYPAGPNAMVADIWSHWIAQQTAGAWHYSGIFLAEVDSIPLAPDWLERIHAEWQGARAARKLVLGHLHAWPWGARPHFNGTMLVAPEFAAAAPEFPRCPPERAWDVAQAAATLAHGQVSRLIYNDPGADTRWDGTFAGLQTNWGGRLPAGHPLRGQVIVPVWKTGFKAASRTHAVIRSQLLPASCQLITDHS